MSSFFTSGSVDTNSFSRDKLPCVEHADPQKASAAVYRISLTDFADHYSAPRGDRTQINFQVVAGPVGKGTRGSHVVMHAADAGWKIAKARGEIAASLGAFLGFTRDASGLKITGDVYGKNVRTLKYNTETGKVVEASGSSDDLPLVKKAAEAFLVVTPYFDKKSGARKMNKGARKMNKGKRSVMYEILPLSANLDVTPASAVADEEFDPSTVDGEDEAPATPAEEAPKPDALELAFAAGWKRNGDTPWFYCKGAEKQLKEPALRALFGG